MGNPITDWSMVKTMGKLRCTAVAALVGEMVGLRLADTECEGQPDADTEGRADTEALGETVTMTTDGDASLLARGRVTLAEGEGEIDTVTVALRLALVLEESVKERIEERVDDSDADTQRDVVADRDGESVGHVVALSESDDDVVSDDDGDPVSLSDPEVVALCVLVLLTDVEGVSVFVGDCDSVVVDVWENVADAEEHLLGDSEPVLECDCDGDGVTVREVVPVLEELTLPLGHRVTESVPVVVPVTDKVGDREGVRLAESDAHIVGLELTEYVEDPDLEGVSDDDIEAQIVAEPHADKEVESDAVVEPDSVDVGDAVTRPSVLLTDCVLVRVAHSVALVLREKVLLGEEEPHTDRLSEPQLLGDGVDDLLPESEPLLDTEVVCEARCDGDALREDVTLRDSVTDTVSDSERVEDAVKVVVMDSFPTLVAEL